MSNNTVGLLGVFTGSALAMITIPDVQLELAIGIVMGAIIMYIVSHIK